MSFGAETQLSTLFTWPCEHSDRILYVLFCPGTLSLVQLHMMGHNRVFPTGDLALSILTWYKIGPSFTVSQPEFNGALRRNATLTLRPILLPKLN